MFQTDNRTSHAASAARIFALIALVFTPVSTAVTNGFSILFLVAALLSPELRRNWRLIYRHPVSLAALLLSISLIVSLAYTVAPFDEALSWLLKYRKLLLVPLLIVVFAGASWTSWSKAVRYGLFASLIFVLALSTTNYLGWTTLGPLHTPTTRAWVFKNHITAGIFSALLFSMCMEMASSAIGRRAKMIYYGLAALTLLNVFVMLQGRTGQVIAVFFCAYHAARLAWLHRGHTRSTMILRTLMFAVPCALLIGISFHLKGDRLADVGNEYHEYMQDNEATSVGLRVSWYRKSVEVFRERPLFGFGVAGLQHEFDLITEGLTGARGMPTQNPHNQYLLMAVELGLVGFALFVNLLVQIARVGRTLPSPSRHLLYAYLFAFTIGCLANSLLLDFSEGYMFVLLTGILLGCAHEGATAVQRAPKGVKIRWKNTKSALESSDLH